MEKGALAELLSRELVIGYVYGYDGGRQVYYFEKSPSGIASFIMLKKENADKIILTDTLDRPILDTYGEFINRCQDQRLLQEITKELIWRAGADGCIDCNRGRGSDLLEPARTAKCMDLLPDRFTGGFSWQPKESEKRAL